MLKKFLAMLLAFVMMLSLTACGGNKPAEPDDDGNRQERVTEEPKKTEENSGTERDGGTCGNRRTRRRAHRRTRRGQCRFSRRYG